jgi:hypothetical protein
MNFLEKYEEKWQAYSNAALLLRCLFKPLDIDFVKREREKRKTGIDPVQLVRFLALKLPLILTVDCFKMVLEKWDKNVLNLLSDRLESAKKEAAKKALASVTPPDAGK